MTGRMTGRITGRMSGRCSRVASLMMVGLLSLATQADAPRDQSIQVTSAWTRPTPEGASMAVGYLTIDNHSQHAVQLRSASSSWAQEVTLHESRLDGGMARMTAVDLKIGAGQRASLKPGGMHLMLMGLTRPYRLGEEVPLQLSFSDGQVIKTSLLVRAEAKQP